MFDKIKKKYTKTLIWMIIIVLFFFSLLIFFIYSNRLIKDYKEKILFFNEQRVSDLERTISQIKYSADSFYSRAGSSISSRSEYELITYMEQQFAINSLITNIFLVDSDLNSINPIRINANFSKSFLENYPSLFTECTPGESWYYSKKMIGVAERELVIHNVLIYLNTVHGDNGKNYTLVMLIPENNLILSSFTNGSTTGFFSKDNYSSQLLIPEDCLLSFPENNSEMNEQLQEITNISDTPVMENRIAIPIIYNEPIKGTPFSLYIYSSGKLLRRQLLNLAAGIFLVFLFVSGTAVFVLHLYMKKLIRGLSYLSDEFTEFSNSLAKQ